MCIYIYVCVCVCVCVCVYVKMSSVEWVHSYQQILTRVHNSKSQELVV